METLVFDFVKIHPNAIIPTKVDGNLGFDLSVVKDKGFGECAYPGQSTNCFNYMLHKNERRIFHTGLKMAMPSGYGVILWDRSGMSVKYGIQKCAGCFDSSYRGEWLVTLWNTDAVGYKVTEGDRIIQAIVIPEFRIVFSECNELDDTFRGEKGFGASGK